LPTCWIMVDRVQPPETASQTPGFPTWLPTGYRLEHDSDVLILRRADDSRRGLPAYCGPEDARRVRPSAAPISMCVLSYNPFAGDSQRGDPRRRLS
jgi:hypothetical protein